MCQNLSKSLCVAARTSSTVIYFPQLSFPFSVQKSILSIMDKSIVLTEHEKKRAMLEERTCMTTGDVKNNPEDLRCPNCGCKYIVFYKFFSYLRKASNRTPAKGQHLSAVSDESGAEYNYCLGCGKRFNDHGDDMEVERDYPPYTSGHLKSR